MNQSAGDAISSVRTHATLDVDSASERASDIRGRFQSLPEKYTTLPLVIVDPA